MPHSFRVVGAAFSVRTMWHCHFIFVEIVMLRLPIIIAISCRFFCHFIGFTLCARKFKCLLLINVVHIASMTWYDVIWYAKHWFFFTLFCHLFFFHSLAFLLIFTLRASPSHIQMIYVHLKRYSERLPSNVIFTRWTRIYICQVRAQHIVARYGRVCAPSFCV